MMALCLLAIVYFNGESFESPHYCSTLRQAEHAAAEVALNSISSHGPNHSLTARILDETWVYKNLLQEISQRVGAPLPHSTYRSGLGHQPVFTGNDELAEIVFTGEPAKKKKNKQRKIQLCQHGNPLNNVLIRMFPAYYKHVLTHEETLVTRFFGLHCV